MGENVVRLDRYTITVEGHRITADAAQEHRIRDMTDEQRARFLAAMGHDAPPD